MTDKAAPQKVIAIDILRAIAALGVFLLHNHTGSVLAHYTRLSFFNRIDAFGAMYAVPLFFLISGYCIHLSNIKYLKVAATLPLKKYYFHRFLRIYPPYLVALIFAIAVNRFAVPNFALKNSDLIIHLFSVQGFSVPYFNTINIVLWTISVELAFYAIYPLFYFLRLKYNSIFALVFTFCVSFISIVYFQTRGNISLPQRFLVFNLWFAWCCGAFLADKITLNPGDLKQPVYKFLYLVIAIGFLYLNLVPNKLYIVFDQLNILIWTAPMIIVLSAENWLRQRKHLWPIKIVGAIGLSSYSLYLLHEPLIYLKNFLVHKYFPVWFQPIGVGLGFIVIPVIAWYSYLFIEKPFISKKKQVVLTNTQPV